MISEHVIFLDTTLRDGEQSPGCSMNVNEKLKMAHALEALGVNIIEAGFAIASDGDRRAIEAISREIHCPVIASLSRARREDIETAARALDKARRSRVHIVLASSDIHLQFKLKITRAEALEQADPRLAQVAQMRYFGGYSEQEIAETLDITERTVQRDWEKARIILFQMMLCA